MCLLFSSIIIKADNISRDRSMGIVGSVIWAVFVTWTLCYSSSIWLNRSGTGYWWPTISKNQSLLLLFRKTSRKEKSMTICSISCRRCILIWICQIESIIILSISAILLKISKVSLSMSLFSRTLRSSWTWYSISWRKVLKKRPTKRYWKEFTGAKRTLSFSAKHVTRRLWEKKISIISVYQ